MSWPAFFILFFKHFSFFLNKSTMCPLSSITMENFAECMHKTVWRTLIHHPTLGYSITNNMSTNLMLTLNKVFIKYIYGTMSFRATSSQCFMISGIIILGFYCWLMSFIGWSEPCSSWTEAFLFTSVESQSETSLLSVSQVLNFIIVSVRRRNSLERQR